MLVAVVVGILVGLLFRALYARFGVPSFVITLARTALGFLGVQIYVLGKHGTINLPFDSALVQFGQQDFLPDAVAYLLVMGS